ncbi:MAG: Glu-tRNA(Gln) amidotransferase subunit GatD [Nitrososphaerota archaeon]
MGFSDRLEGYTGKVREVLESAEVDIGDEVEIVVDESKKFRGILMSRYELADPDFIVLKLPNGYNLGIRFREKIKVEKLSETKKPIFKPLGKPQHLPSLPKVTIIGTGGTIASRIDYRTGAVRPVLTVEDLLSIIPELASIAELDASILFSMFSEDMTPREWSMMAEKIDQYIKKGVDGVVIAHGTDTMGYSAAALSFALQKPPIPIVLVGAQRSSDRPSSDSATNLIAAVKVAGHAPFGEVCVAMHHSYSDDIIAIHRGTRVRKNHTSSRDAFKSVNTEPVAFYKNGEIIVNRKDLNTRYSGQYVFNPKFSDKALLLKFFPGMSSEIIEDIWMRGYRGIIIEGSGLGHVARRLLPMLKKILDDGIFVGMTSQCIYGRVNMRVYSTGRDLLRIGVTPLDDMLPETAYVKLSWALAQSTDIEEIEKIMLTPLAGEIGERSLP